jgi:hypothetical protein
MSDLSEEVYREKYLKYKKKYITALENMKGGYNNQPLTADSTIYFCTQETYERLQQSGRDNTFLEEDQLHHKDECFIDRMMNPFKCLMIKDNKLKLIDGNDAKIPNYPFLCGRKLGIKEEDTLKMKGILNKVETHRIAEKPFDHDFAMMQLQDSEPIIKKLLSDINNNKIIENVYFLHTYRGSDTKYKKVSYNNTLEHVSFPTIDVYLQGLASNPQDLVLDKKHSPAQQVGGFGPSKFYFCNPAATAAINQYYFINSNTTVDKINEKCLNDIALDKVLGPEQIPVFAILEEQGLAAYIHKNRSATIIDRISLPSDTIGKFGVSSQIVQEKGWLFGGLKNVTKHIYNEENVKKHIPMVKEILFNSLLTTNQGDITVFKLKNHVLSTFEDQLPVSP